MSLLLLVSMAATSLGHEETSLAACGALERAEAFGRMLKGRLLVNSVRVGMTPDEAIEILGPRFLIASETGSTIYDWPDYGISLYCADPSLRLGEHLVLEVRYNFRWPRSHR